MSESGDTAEQDEHAEVKEELVTLFELTLEMEDDLNNFFSGINRVN